MNYIQNLIKIDEEKHNVLPLNWCGTKVHTITFSGWGPLTIEIDNCVFNEIIQMAASALNNFVEMYKDDYAFERPILRWTPGGNFTLEITTMEMDTYLYQMEKEKEKDELAMD